MIGAGYFSLDKSTGIWSLQLRGSKCALHYLRGWALVDIISILPFDLVLLAVPALQSKTSSALVKIPRCLKLLRLPRLFRCGAEKRMMVYSWSDSHWSSADRYKNLQHTFVQLLERSSQADLHIATTGELR